MSVDTPYSTEYQTIVNLRDCRRCFHFRAIFHIANVMPPADPCSISRLAVQFWWFWRLKLVSHFTLLQAICKMFVLDKDHHSIYNLFKVFLFDYDVDESNILSQNLELFYCCIETISPTLRFYIRLLISLTIARYEIVLVWEVLTSQKNVITSQNIPQKLLNEFLLATKQNIYSLSWMYV